MLEEDLQVDDELELEEDESDPEMVWLAERFAAALQTVPDQPLALDLGLRQVYLEPGIQSTIKYSHDEDNFLGTRHNYSWVDGKRRELSMQLYENTSCYHRLFAYVKRGMLFSVNLTLGYKDDGLVHLTQQLKIGSGPAHDREIRREELITRLSAMGYDIDKYNIIDLGDFDPASGEFRRTTPEKFVRDFLTVALLKGHFMGNKGYSLD